MVKPLLIALSMASICLCLFANTVPVAPAEAKQYLNHLLPLPHKIAMEEKAILNPDGVSLKLRKGATDIEKNAFSILEGLFKEQIGRVPTGKDFEIIIGMLDKDGKVAGIAVENAEKLRSFPNNDQAYLIRPINNNKLIITGLSGKGVYYGVRTLCQLLTPLLSKSKLTLPLVKIEDWPDLAERGFWNGAQGMVEYLAPLKINSANYLVEVMIDEKTKKRTAELDITKIENARLNAINCWAKIRHLNFVLPENNAYSIYPELAGKGKGAVPVMNPTGSQSPKINEARVPCAKHSILQEIITDWLEDLGGKGALNIEVWTSEFYAQCECEECRKEGQFFLEAKAFRGAWLKAREKHPDLRLKINNSFRLPDQEMDKFLSVFPPEIEVGRACYLGKTRHIPRDMFEDFQYDARASRGRWVGCYEMPDMKILKFQALIYKDLIASLLARHWKGGYILLNTGGAKFNWEANKWNINALAEWSWNNEGRNIKEFACAYATINGYKTPEKFEDWAEIIAPIEYDLYGSCMAFLGPYWFLNIEKIVSSKKRGNDGKLGYGYFRYFPTPESFDDKIALCRKALEIAANLNRADMILESRLCLCAVSGTKTVNRIIQALESSEVNQSGLKDCLKTLKAIAAERMAIVNERNNLYAPSLQKYYKIEAGKAAGNISEEFVRYLESELKPILK